MSIQARLILLVVATLVPALAAGLFEVNDTYRRERAMLERSVRETGRALSMVVDRELARRDAIARVLASSPYLDGAPELTPAELEAFQRQATEASAGLQGWVELSTPQGELLSTRQPVPGPAPLGRGGAPAPPPPELAFTDQARVNPLASARGGAPRAAVTRPVVRDGRVVLNVSVTLLPSELQAISVQHRVPQGWISAVLDNRGTVVARSPSGEPWIGQPATADLRERIRQRGEDYFPSQSLDGRPTWAYYHTAPSGWTYVVAVPRDALRANLERSIRQIGLAGGFLLALALLAAWWVARGIARPVRTLAASARALQRGRPVLPQATGIREFDQVSAALSEASENILRAHADMEREVAAAVMTTREAEQRVSHSQRVEALGRLTGGVAHDFNNLLGVIANSAHLLQRLPPDRDRSAPLAAIQRAVEVGSRLTQHLLRFARRQPVQPGLVDLRLMLPDSGELLKTVVGASIRITIAVEPDTPAVRVDVSELELALINLALNARDAMPGGGDFTVSARRASAAETAGLDGGTFVAVSASDSGPGVPAELRERVFEPFFTTKVVGKGTGLGLSQVHGFCRQAGGDARIDTPEGGGTVVTLVLPAEPVADPPQGPAAEPVSTAPEHAHGTVLLVEDNASLGDVTESLLRSFGYGVLRAATAAEALEVLARPGQRVDVVLSDVVMPGELDGLGLAQHLRAHRPRLPVVLITGFSTAMTAPQGFTLLHKPAPPPLLLKALQDEIAKHR